MKRIGFDFLIAFIFIGIYIIIKQLGWLPDRDTIYSNGWTMFIYIGLILTFLLLSWIRRRHKK